MDFATSKSTDIQECRNVNITEEIPVTTKLYAPSISVTKFICFHHGIVRYQVKNITNNNTFSPLSTRV